MSRAAEELVEELALVLGAPVIHRFRSGQLSPPSEPLGAEIGRLYRFRCPVCGGGFDDRLYRPLCVRDDGAVFCQAALERGFGDPTCNFTLEGLTVALRRMRQEAAA
ncbi:MAG: hypothetical protein ACR2IP_05855 [Solirubrobacteraceae bacterium]